MKRNCAGLAMTLPSLTLTIVAIMGSAVTYFVVEGPLIQLLKPRSRTAALAREALGA